MNRAHSMTMGTAALIAALVAGCGSSDPAPAGGAETGGATGTGGASSTSGGASSTSGGASSTSGGASSTAGGTTGASGGTTGASGGTTGASGGTTGASGGSSAGGAGPVCTAGTGKCNNATDCAIAKADMEGWEPACAQSSLGTAGPTATCMVGHGLTQACADCWGGVAACGAQNCLTQCLTDSSSKGCRDCTAQHCDAAFATCAGI